MARAWVTVDRCETPEGGLELRRRAADDFLICIAGRVLMNSRASLSERALADLACALMEGRPAPRVLIGGLGMGLTLRAALDTLAPEARVYIAELNPVVVEWCRGPLAELNGSCMSDPRVEVVVGDVAQVIRRWEREELDAIVLDLYEGPHAGSDAQRDPFYGSAALAGTRAALAAGGVFAVWSEDPDAAFERRLQKAGFRVERHRPGRGGRRHAVTLGVRG